MKYTLLLALVLTLCSCGNKKKAAQAEYWRMIAEYRVELEERKIAEKKAQEEAKAREEAEKIAKFEAMLSKYPLEPYRTVSEIDSELWGILNDLYEIVGEWDWENAEEKLKLFTTRLEFHLNNPLTFNNQLPRLDSLIAIVSTPDKRYKFYSFDEGGHGTMRCYLTYIQYKDDSERVTFQPWQDKVRFDYNKLYTGAWQFTHKGANYYVLKSYKRGQSRTWAYYMEIVTIEDGIPAYHTEFYPEGIYEPHEYNMVDLELAEPEYYAPAYDVCVCYTDFADPIGYTFNPRTRTVNVTEYEGNIEHRTEVKRSWKLVNIE